MIIYTQKSYDLIEQYADMDKEYSKKRASEVAKRSGIHPFPFMVWNYEQSAKRDRDLLYQLAQIVWTKFKNRLKFVLVITESQQCEFVQAISESQRDLLRVIDAYLHLRPIW